MGVAVLIFGLTEMGALQFLIADVAAFTVGWGPFVEVLTGLYTPTSGAITYQGTNITGRKPRYSKPFSTNFIASRAITASALKFMVV